MSPAKKETIVVIVILSLLILGSLFYYFRNSFNTDQELPPQLKFSSTTTFKGQLSADIVCRFNNIHKFSTADINRYANARNNDQEYPLESGLHLYHTEQDMTVEEIMEAIEPDRNNQVAIAFYNYGLDNRPTGFHVYPPNGPFRGANEITDADDFTIPANNGFVIMSCEDTRIKGVRPETIPAEDYPAELTTTDDGWVLVASTGNLPLSAALYPYRDKIRSIWVQTDEGFEFPASATLNSATPSGDYQMMWIRLDGSLTTNPPTNSTGTGNSTGGTGNVNYNNSTCDNQCPGRCQLIYNGVYYCADQPVYTPTGSSTGSPSGTGLGTGSSTGTGISTGVGTGTGIGTGVFGNYYNPSGYTCRNRYSCASGYSCGGNNTCTGTQSCSRGQLTTSGYQCASGYNCSFELSCSRNYQCNVSPNCI